MLWQRRRTYWLLTVMFKESRSSNKKVCEKRGTVGAGECTLPQLWHIARYPASARRGVLITANVRLVAGGCAADWGAQGSNDGGQWPGASGGRFVAGDSLLLMSRPERSASRSRTHQFLHSRRNTHRVPDSCSLLDFPFALGRNMGIEKQTAGSVCPGAHHTPSISQLLASHPCSPSLPVEETQSFLPQSFPQQPLGCIGPVSLQLRYNPIMPLNYPEVECSSWMPMGPAGFTPAGAG